MKNVLYLSIIILFVFGGCKKKKTPDPVPTPEPAPTINYVSFTMDGPGYVNRKIVWSKAKNIIQRQEYSEATNGVITVDLEMVSGDVMIQIHFNE